jgi:hypothetical protein
MRDDVRDTSKVATLPDDLRSIADQMIGEKFSLAEKGEVVDHDYGDVDPKQPGDVMPGATTTSSDAVYPFSEEWMASPATVVIDPEYNQRARKIDYERLHRTLREVIYRYPAMGDIVLRSEVEHERQCVHFHVESAITGQGFTFAIDATTLSKDYYQQVAGRIDYELQKLARRTGEPIIAASRTKIRRRQNFW